MPNNKKQKNLSTLQNMQRLTRDDVELIAPGAIAAPGAEALRYFWVNVPQDDEPTIDVGGTLWCLMGADAPLRTDPSPWVYDGNEWRDMGRF